MLNRLGTEITQVGWFPRRGLFDMSTIIVGTFMIVLIAMVVAVPLGLGAAIYLSEYASPRVRRFVKPILEILAGIPSVVLAYFAITFINPNIVVRFFNPTDRAFSMLAAGIAVGVLTVPIIASVTEDALRAVPLSLREASFGLGAQRAQTTFRVVFPAGVSGIVAALILGISRAIGETMVVAIAAGAVGGALFHFSPLEPGQTMTAAMAGLSFGSDQVAGNEAAFQSLFFIGALLFVMTLAAQRARRQARQPGPRGVLMFRSHSFARCARSLHSGELDAGGLRPHEHPPHRSIRVGLPHGADHHRLDRWGGGAVGHGGTDQARHRRPRQGHRRAADRLAGRVAGDPRRAHRRHGAAQLERVDRPRHRLPHQRSEHHRCLDGRRVAGDQGDDRR